MLAQSQPSARQIGRFVEQNVCDYLLQQGLKLITQNYSCELGEIDLIMQDQDTRVFIEVRYRGHGEHGNALESVTYKKQRKIIRTAHYYLLENNLLDQIPCRFDVIAWDKNPAKIQWIKDAFWVKY